MKKKIIFTVMIMLCCAISFGQVKNSTKKTKRINTYLNELEKVGFSGTVLVEINGNKVISKGYGFSDKEDVLSQLLALNLSIAEKEKKAEKVQPPGLPDFVKDKESYVSDECVRFEW